LSLGATEVTADKSLDTSFEKSRLSKFFAFKGSVAFFIKIFVALFVLALFVDGYHKSQQEQQATDLYIGAPKIDDIYFLDFRVMSEDLRPREKYRLAKVVDITGDIVTLRYGNVFYWQQHSLIDSIRYGQLRQKKYFEPKRYDFNLTELKNLRETNAIYQVKRPDLNILYGNYVNPLTENKKSSLYIPGKRENLAGLGFLKSTYIEDNFSQAFTRFTRSAELGHAEGQVNLGEMYINAQFVELDLDKALYWLKRASLQSNKAGILKYVIVCKQVSYCEVSDFYQELIDSGVNIKVRKIDFNLSSTVKA